MLGWVSVARKHTVAKLPGAGATKRTGAPGPLAPLLRRAAEAVARLATLSGDPELPGLALELNAAALTETTPIKGLPVARFLTIVMPLLPLLSVPPPEMRTPAWYGKVGKLLRQSGLTEDLAAELGRKVAGWATVPISIETLVAGAARYLSAPDPSRLGKQAKTGGGPLPMFDEDE